MTDERLIKIITVKMEEYGMPVFTDKFPAMDILQLVKDSGYVRQRPNSNTHCSPIRDGFETMDWGKPPY